MCVQQVSLEHDCLPALFWLWGPATGKQKDVVSAYKYHPGAYDTLEETMSKRVRREKKYNIYKLIILMKDKTNRHPG